MAIQTVAVVETERLQRAWQGYYRTPRPVRQAEKRWLISFSDMVSS
jgi:hypothetical protein